MPTYTTWLNSDIEALNDNLIAAIGGSGPVGVQRTLNSYTFNSATAPANIPAGAKWINFSTDADFTGTIGGQAFPASSNYLLPPMGNDTYAAVAFTVPSGTVRVDYTT